MNHETATNHLLVGAEEPARAQAGLASWEEPSLPLLQAWRKRWRQMLVHAWGPAGSLVFHVAAVGVLATCVSRECNEVLFAPPAEYPPAPTKEPLDPPPPVPPPKDLPQAQPEPEPPDLPVERTEHETTYATSPIDMPGPIGPQDGASNMGSGPQDRPNTGLDVDAPVNNRLILPGLLRGELGGGRRQRLKQYLTGPQSTLAWQNETAVKRALRWLKREQLPDGSWKGSKQDVPPAMTSLALLAFLAHAETPDAPEFGATVKKAITWLLENQESDGRFKGRDAHDYSQPLAAYALCEASALTQIPRVREAAIRAVTRVVQGQNAAGGFNYNLDQSPRNDTSYMAWCCQALKAAKAARLQDDVPGLESAMKKAIAGFRLNADPSGGFGYDGVGRGGLSGAGALCLQLLGDRQGKEVAHTLKFLEPCTFSFATPNQQPYGAGSPIYYWYYITQAKFNDGKETFDPWDKQFSTELRRTQIVEKNAVENAKGQPADVGHWESPSKGEHTGGTVQDTALCTLMLEVYYRYLSAQKQDEEEPRTAAAPATAGTVGPVAIR